MSTLRTAVALGVVATLVAVPVFTAVDALGDGGQLQLFLVVGMLVGVVVAAAVVGRRRARSRGRGREGDGRTATDEATSVWDLVPAWQYTGRHAESGGLARDDQERALERVREQADEPKRRPTDRE